MKTEGTITKKRRLILFALASGFVGAIVALVVFWSVASNGKSYVSFHERPLPAHYASLQPGSAVPPSNFTVAAELTVNAVVHIKTYYQRKSSVYDDFFGFYDFFGYNPYQRSYPVEASGSGVIISDNGYVVTNNHVVQEAEKIEVTLNDKRTYEATLIGRDPSTDLALIKIEADDLPFIIFGNSDDVHIGEWVLAVGNPFNLTSTVTAGIVSAKARNINILGDQSAIESFIQTDAAVNRGNSGGALVNTRGELVGVNAAIASNTGAYTGYSFAIPANIVKKVVNDLMEHGTIQRAYFGVSIREVDSKLAEEKGLERIKGVYIAGITDGGAAENAGIKAGDVLLKINDHDINSSSQMLETIGRHRPGDKIKVVVERNGKEIAYSVTLLNKRGGVDVVKKEEITAVSLLGAEFEEVTDEELKKIGVQYGVRVKGTGNGKLKDSGIKNGFIITAIDNNPVKSIADIERYLNNKSGGVLIEGVYPNGMRAYYAFGL